MDAGLGGFGSGLVLGAVGDEGPLYFIRVQESRLLAVGLAQFILVGIGFDAQEIWPWETIRGGYLNIIFFKGGVP